MAEPTVQKARRLRATISAIALAAVVLAGCASQHPTQRSGTTSGRSVTTASPSTVRTTGATATHVFAAFDSSGAPIAGVRAHRSGYCFASSITVAARGAYRCLAGSSLLDPCFAASAKSAVFCYAGPWSAAVALRLTKALPAPGAPLKIARPWALELAGGTRCVVSGGATPLLHGVPMGYRCATAAAGLLSMSRQPLEVLLQAANGTTSHVVVTATWSA